MFIDSLRYVSDCNKEATYLHNMVSVQYTENLAIVDKGTRPQKNDKWKRGAIKNWRPPSTSGPTIKNV